MLEFPATAIPSQRIRPLPQSNSRSHEKKLFKVVHLVLFCLLCLACPPPPPTADRATEGSRRSFRRSNLLCPSSKKSELRGALVLLSCTTVWEYNTPVDSGMSTRRGLYSRPGVVRGRFYFRLLMVFVYVPPAPAPPVRLRVLHFWSPSKSVKNKYFHGAK